jgi:TonB family protein
MSVTRFCCVLVALFGIAASTPIASAGEDTLDRAKTLYASADYDEALAVLDRLEDTTPGTDPMSIAEYRVFCLLALNRSDEARQGIDRILHDRPLYMPSENETSPRIRTVFRTVRREALPKIVLERYAAAKAAFERKDPVAAQQFDEIVTLLNDADLHDVPALQDLREVASAFRDLARVVAAPAESQKSVAQAAAPAPNDVPDIIYTASDTDVTPPVAQSEKTPQWHPASSREASQEYRGMLRLLIDQSGAVVSATMATGVRPEYDQALIRAAREWKFRPAQKQGKAVRYLKLIEIHLRPGT